MKILAIQKKRNIEPKEIVEKFSRYLKEIFRAVNIDEIPGLKEILENLIKLSKEILKKSRATDIQKAIEFKITLLKLSIQILEEIDITDIDYVLMRDILSYLKNERNVANKNSLVQLIKSKTANNIGSFKYHDLEDNLYYNLLHFVGRYQNLQFAICTEALIVAGIDVNAFDKSEKTALDLAIERKEKLSCPTSQNNFYKNDKELLDLEKFIKLLMINGGKTRQEIIDQEEEEQKNCGQSNMEQKKQEIQYEPPHCVTNIESMEFQSETEIRIPLSFSCIMTIESYESTNNNMVSTRF